MVKGQWDYSLDGYLLNNIVYEYKAVQSQSLYMGVKEFIESKESTEGAGRRGPTKEASTLWPRIPVGVRQV